MPREALVFGGGIDRETGLLTASPSAFRDLRNVSLMRGRTSLRAGLARLVSTPGTSLIGVYPLRSQGFTAAIAFDAGTRNVVLYVLDAAGGVANLVGTIWPAIHANAVPRVIAEDFYDSLVIAHDDPNMAYRKVTRVYRPRAGTLTDFTANLDRTGQDPVRFRGVKRWLSYLIGWGYGTFAEQDRAETLRISLPGELVFEPQHYFNVGGRGDAILGCDQTGDALAIQKLMESHKLIGYDRASFGVRPLDGEFGRLGSRLATSVNGEMHCWSISGPRMSTGGPSEDMGLMLGLDDPAVDPAAIANENGFTYHDADAGEIVHVFGQWGFVLHLKDGARRWSYRTYGVPLVSAGIVYTGGVPALASTSEPTIGALTPTNPAYTLFDHDAKIAVVWSLGGVPLGTEQIEVWSRPLAGPNAWRWTKSAQVAASALTANITVTDFLTTHEIALRLTDGGYPRAGYTSLDPAQWPATARGEVTTLGGMASWTYTVWQRFSAEEQGYLMKWAGPSAFQDDFDANGVLSQRASGLLTFREEYSLDAGVTWVPLRRETIVGVLEPDALRLPNLVSLKSTIVRIRAEGPHAVGTWLTLAAKVIAPEPPASVTAVYQNFMLGRTLPMALWDAPAAVAGIIPADGPYEAYGQCQGGLGPDSAFNGAPSAVVQVANGIHMVELDIPDITTIAAPGPGPYATWVYVRVRREEYGIVDVSEWAEDFI